MLRILFLFLVGISSAHAIGDHDKYYHTPANSKLVLKKDIFIPAHAQTLFILDNGVASTSEDILLSKTGLACGIDLSFENKKEERIYKAGLELTVQDYDDADYNGSTFYFLQASYPEKPHLQYKILCSRIVRNSKGEFYETAHVLTYAQFRQIISPYFEIKIPSPIEYP